MLVFLFSYGCNKKTEPVAAQKPVSPHGMEMDEMHGHAKMGGMLDVDAMLTDLPKGWTKTEPSQSMRLVQINLDPAPGDKNPAELAVFHFPGTGGSTQANIHRWQNQFKGPHGEPGDHIAKTDTMMVGLLTVITTDVTGTQLGGGAMMGTGPADDIPDSRMIASVIETPSGNWFIKVVGPQKTIAAHEKNIREFVKRAKLKDSAH